LPRQLKIHAAPWEPGGRTLPAVCGAVRGVKIGLEIWRWAPGKRGADTMRSWIWALAILAVVVVGGGAFAMGMLLGRGESRPPQVQLVPMTPEEKELQKIKIVASGGELVEASRDAEGWTVRVTYHVKPLDPQRLHESTLRFFRELARSGVPIKESSFELRTSDLKDVWGNTLKDVPILKVSLKRETFERINWQGFEPKNFERVADDYWIHDEVKRSEQKPQGQDGSENQSDQAGSGQGGQGGQS